jgi:thiol-disulfide isomerase/thioredoxin
MLKTIRRFGVAAALWLISTTLSAEQTLPWEPTLESAQRQAVQTQRLVYAHFWAPWCGPCQRMEKEVFQQPAVATQVNANYVPVKINADQYPDLARRYGIEGLPTEAILTPQGQLIHAFNWRNDRINAALFVARLNQTATAYRQQTGVQVAKTPSGVLSGNGVQAPAAGGLLTATPVNPAPRSAQDPSQTTVLAAPSQLNPPATGSGPILVVPSPAYGQPVGTTLPNNPPAGPGQAVNATGPGGPLSGGLLPAPNATPVLSPANTPANPLVGTMPPGSPGLQASVPPVAANVPVSNSISPGNPPLDLEGYCPVTLVEKKKWVRGDVRYGAIHRGRTYLFAGPNEQRRFFDNPDLIAPMNSGYDVVLGVEQKKLVPGLREFGVTYAGHIFLFADRTTRDRFEKNHAYYAKQAFDQLRAAPTPGLPPVR